MASFCFVATKVKVNKKTVRFSGVYTGTIPKKGTVMNLISLDNKPVELKVYSASENDKIETFGRQKGADISLSINEDDERNYEVYDVITDAADKENPDLVDNRRGAVLMWMYNQDKKPESLGAFAEFMSMEGRFYVICVKRRGRNVITTLELKNGHRYYPLFTSREEIVKNSLPSGAEVMIMTFDRVVELLHEDKLASGIIVNPWSGNLQFRRGDIAKLRDMKKSLN